MPKFYITTPIYYVNDKPHIGHAYTTTVADIVARWHRLRGDDVFFLTGTDEHGEKIQKAAESALTAPQNFVDDLAMIYKDTWEKLNISYDCFIRTSDPAHKELVQKFISRVYENGDIYKGKYEGWYCVSDETFFTDLQIKEGNLCPQCGREVKLIQEDDYFFRLSDYQERLLQFYKDNPAFLSPKSRADEVKNRVAAGLKDLCITRSAIKWGVQFPVDNNYTIYVWVDALLNYITALNWPDGNFEKFWPADVHIVGKEINWFHTVIWPALLFSARIDPPKKVFAHGWWTVEGKKMSKSMGNGIDPLILSEKYSTDALRYFMIREIPLGEDGDFSEKALKARLNGELASDLGNLVYRVLTIAEKFDGKIEGTPELEKKLELGKIIGMMDDLNTLGAINKIFEFIGATNKYVNDTKPWALRGEELGNALYNLLESCRVISILIYPFMPETSEKIAQQLGTKIEAIDDCKFGKFSGKVSKGAHLFNRIE